METCFCNGKFLRNNRLATGTDSRRRLTSFPACNFRSPLFLPYENLHLSHLRIPNRLATAGLIIDMGVYIVFATVLSCVLFSLCFGYPTGAPPRACSDLTPVHKNNLPQQSQPPYNVAVSKMGDKVKVTISSPFGENFQGFIIQARSNRDRRQIVDGTFTPRNGVSRTIVCSNGLQNTLTQVDKTNKGQIVTEWTPGIGVDEEVVFRATVVQTYQTFWTEIDSSPVKVRYNNQGNTNSEQSGNFDTESMYDNCFVSKGCFGYPVGCVTQRNCGIFLSYVDVDSGVSFTMIGRLASPQNYMAMGLSTDRLMGDDSVTECFMENGRVVVQHSRNVGKSNTPVVVMPEGMYEWEFKNGVTSCTWIRPYVQTMDESIDLLNNTYYILIAQGPVVQGRKQFHSDGFTASQDDVNFTSYELIKGEGTHDAVKIHGTFMVTAWVAFVSLGILLARHFKNSWENRMVCGVKVWFAFHRGLMIAAMGFVVIAFIVIFVHKKGWNYSTKNPHAVLGCIATAFGLFQPIMAAFRPSPDNPKRPIFNWLHWAVGNGAQIIAVVTIFFAVTLEGSGLKKSFYWVMAVFVVVHCFFHFFFQVHSWTLLKKKNNEIKMLEMSSGRTNVAPQDNQNKALSGDVFRILLLGVYTIFLAVIMLALYVLIGTA